MGDVTHWSPTWAHFAGGIGSNQDDVHVFLDALGSGELLTDEYHEIQLAPTTVGIGANERGRVLGDGSGLVNGWAFMNPGIPGYDGAGGTLPDEGWTMVVYTTPSPATDPSNVSAKASSASSRASCHRSTPSSSDPTQVDADSRSTPERANDISLYIVETRASARSREDIMSGSYMGDGFTGPAGGWGQGRPGQGLWEVMDQLRGMFEQKVAPRMGRGDVRAAVLALLAERPMHGYQIIAEIAERSGGAWKPSPGSVYPTLQLLADEGLISAEESDGRKTTR